MKLKVSWLPKTATKLSIRDATGIDTKVILTPATSIKTKGGFFGGGDKIANEAIVRGLNLEVEGQGDGSALWWLNKVRFGKDDLRVAQSIDSRVTPAEDRLTSG